MNPDETNELAAAEGSSPNLAAQQQDDRSKGLETNEAKLRDLLDETGVSDHVVLEIYNAARMSPRERNVISEWLRRQAARLESGGDSYPAVYVDSLNQLNS